MAWNVKYYAEWNDFLGYRNRVEFLVEDTVEEAEEIIMQEFKIKYPEIDFFGDASIYGCGADMTVISPTMLSGLDKFYTINPLGVQVRHYLLNYEEQEEYLNFIGYLDTEQYDDPISERINYGITITANNGVNLLDRFALRDDVNANYTGVFRVIDLIKICLDKLQIDYDNIFIKSGTFINGISYSAGENILHKLYTKAENYYDEKDEAFSCKEALHSVFLALGMKMYIHNNSIYLIDVQYLRTLQEKIYNFPPKYEYASIDIRSLAIQSDGKILCGGRFLKGIKRFNKDGTEDTEFYTNLGTGFTHIDGGYNYSTGVYSIMVQSDGRILCSGAFYEVNGLSRVHIARLNNDGTLDTSFNNGGGGYVGNIVNSVKIKEDKIYLVGDVTDYSKIGGFLNAPGGICVNFNGDIVFPLYNDGAITKDIQFASNGKIYKATNTVIRLNEDGSLDNTFNVSSISGGLVHSIAVQSDGKVLAAGAFTAKMIRLNTDGTIDNTFTAPALLNNTVEKILIHDGKIFVAGNFGIIPGSLFDLCRLNMDGSLDNTFAGTFTSGENQILYTLLVTNNELFVGGRFKYQGDFLNYSYFTKLNMNGGYIPFGVVYRNLQTYRFTDLEYQGETSVFSKYLIDERLESHGVSMSSGRNKVNIRFNKYCYSNPTTVPITSDTLSGYLKTFDIYEDNNVKYREYIYSACKDYEVLGNPLMVEFVNKKSSGTSSSGGEFFVRLKGELTKGYKIRIHTGQFFVSAPQYIGISGQVMAEDLGNYGVETNYEQYQSFRIYFRVNLHSSFKGPIISRYRRDEQSRPFPYWDVLMIEPDPLPDVTIARATIIEYPRVKYNRWYDLNGYVNYVVAEYQDMVLYSKTLQGIIIPLNNDKYGGSHNTIPGGFLSIDIWMPQYGEFGYKNLLLKDIGVSLLKKNEFGAFDTIENTDTEFQGFLNPFFKNDLSIEIKQGTDLVGNSRGLFLLRVTGSYIDSLGTNQRYVGATSFTRALSGGTLEEELLSLYLENLQMSRYMFTCQLKGYYPIFTNFEFPLLKRDGQNVQMIPISMEVDYVNSRTKLNLLEYVTD